LLDSFGAEEDQTGMGVHAAASASRGADGHAGMDGEGVVFHSHEAISFKKVVNSWFAGVQGNLTTRFKADDEGFEIGEVDDELRLWAIGAENGEGGSIGNVDFRAGCVRHGASPYDEYA